MQGDPVHPGPPGQLMMAAALLKGLGAERFVSSVTLDAAGKVSRPRGARSDGVKSDGGSCRSTGSTSACRFPFPTKPARCWIS